MDNGLNTHAGDLFQILRDPNAVLPPDVDEQFPFYPLDAPGMPLPGEDFVRMACAMGDPMPEYGKLGSVKTVESHGPNLHYLYRRALYDEQFMMPVNVRGVPTHASFVPGHLIGDQTQNMNGGPRPAKVMIIGKNPLRDEVEHQQNLVSPAAQIFFDVLTELGVPQTESFDWYCTNLVKFMTLDVQADGLPIAHKKDCEILLQQELRLVRPDYILCLGSDASKWLLGTNYGVNAMVGRVEEYTFPTFERGEDPQYHTCKVMAATHPAAVHRRTELYPELLAQVALFLSLVNGAEIGGRETFIDHRVVSKYRELQNIVDEIIADPDPKRRIIAVDAEWHGENPGEPGAYLRTVQFSSSHGEGICVVLRHQGGSDAFKPSIGHAVSELNRLLQPDPATEYRPRVGGHFFRADLPWLIHEGIDVRKSYEAAPAVELCRAQGGFDTGLMYHAVNETASYRLTDMTVRLTQAPVYDAGLKKAIEGYCKQHSLKKEDLEGFGFLPEWVLHPGSRDPEWGENYAQYDADVTRRIAMAHLDDGGLLDSDWYDNSSWEPYWRNHLASLGVLEMEMTGIMLDRERVDELTSIFMDGRVRLLEDFRQQINWPTFNPESPKQCVAFLFGDEYAFKRDKATGQCIAIRPPDALSLGLTPIKSTGKRPRLWHDLVARGETHQYSPSTDKEVLGILGHHHPLAMQLRDLKFITQVLKMSLRPPLMTEDATAYVQDDDGNRVYGKGLAACVMTDGRVHTHISQNKETGRGSSARPPLQNISKRREGDYSRILGYRRKNKETGEMEAHGDYRRIFPQPLYKAPVRTIFRASPGHVLIEADYTGAELAAIAWLANDRNMIEHVRRNTLPENHPDHHDIHSNTAVRTFQLDCPATKRGLKESGHSPLRVAAKNVNFGIPYGRSAEAIARQCREEGVDVSVAECEQMIAFYFEQYPSVGAFLEACRHRSQNEQWMVGAFGRFRRFITSKERSVIAEQQRQAQNFPIQNTVADAVWQAIYNVQQFRIASPEVPFRMLLQIHDALLFEVPFEQVIPFAIDKTNATGEITRPSVIRETMVNRVPIWPRYLDNTPMPVKEPYFFGIDQDIQINWGEGISSAQAEREGMPEEVYAAISA